MSPHILSVSDSLHKHCYLFLRGRWISILILFYLILLFHIFNRKINFRRFYSFYAIITFNCFICLSESRLYVSPWEWLYDISTLETNLLISNFMQYISYIALKKLFHLDAYLLLGPAFLFTFFYQTVFLLDEWFILLKLLHQFHSNINVTLIFKIYLFGPLFSFSMVLLLLYKLVWQPYFMQ